MLITLHDALILTSLCLITLQVFRYHDEQFFQRGKRTFLLKNCVDYAYKLKSPPVQSDRKYVYLE